MLGFRKNRPTAEPVMQEERVDEPVQLAELYAAAMSRSGDGRTLEALEEAERSFLMGQLCEVRLRGGGFAQAARDPRAEQMAQALHRMGATQTAGLLDAALLARDGGEERFAARCRELDASWREDEEEIARFSAAWARNHGMMS